MKVLAFSPVSYFKGGAERSFFDIVSNPNVTFIVTAPDEGPIAAKARLLGMTVNIVPFGAVETIHRPLRVGAVLRAVRDWLKAALEIRKITRLHHVDVVHSNGLKAHSIAVLARWLGGAPVVVHIRDIANTQLEKLAFKLLGRLANRVVLVSRACWPGAGELPLNVQVVHNGVELPAILPIVRMPVGTPISIGICGRIHPAKGHHLLASWIASAKAAGYQVRLLVRGEATDSEQSYVSELRRLFARYRVENELVFEGNKEGLENVYGGLDLVIVPSQTPDPLPRSVMESMALGIPVAGYPAGGITDMIVHRKTGWLVSDEIQFKSCLKDLTDDRLTKEITAGARRLVSEEFTLPRLHMQLSELYAKSVNSYSEIRTNYSP